MSFEEQKRLYAEEAVKRFPYPIEIVRGAETFAAFQRLKAARRGWPVVLGGDEAMLRMADGFIDFDNPTQIEPLSGDALTRAVQASLAKVRPSFDATLAEFKAAEDLAFKAFVGAMPAEQRRAFEERQAEFEQANSQLGHPDADEPPLGEWAEPNTPTPAGSDIVVAIDSLTDAPFERVYIALLPTTDPTEAPAYLNFGFWNACPPPQVHVAALRDWRDRYGAELVGIAGDTLEVRVARPPTDRDDALRLARQMYAYCPDTVDQGPGYLRTLAVELMSSHIWPIWWD